MKAKTGKSKWIKIGDKYRGYIVYPYSPKAKTDKNELALYLRSYKVNGFQITV